MEHYVVLALLTYTTMQTPSDAPREISEAPVYTQIENERNANCENPEVDIEQQQDSKKSF